MKERTKKILKKNLILMGIGTVIVGTLAVVLVINIEKKAINIPPYEAKETERTYEYEDDYVRRIVSTSFEIDKIIDKDYFVISDSITDKYGVMDYTGKIVDDVKYKSITVLPDGYYLTETDDSKELKRKNNIIEVNPESNKLYQDTNEENAPYVMISDNCYGCATETLNGNYRAAQIDKKYDVIGYDEKNHIDTIYGSIIYDAKEGKIIKEVPGKVVKSRDLDNLYTGTYNNSTWFSLATLYDQDFNSLLKNGDFFQRAQCSANEYSAETRNINSPSAGYYSIEQRKDILPKRFDNIYSHNKSETLFVVIENGKYDLVNNEDTTLLSGYDYMVNIRDFIITEQGNELRILDSNLNVVKEYTIEKNNETIKNYNGGLCDTRHPNLYFKYNGEDIYSATFKVIIPTTNGIIALEITDEVKEIEYDEKKIFNDPLPVHKLNDKYSFTSKEGKTTIYKGEELVRTIDSILNFSDYNDEYKYIIAREDGYYRIYELK